MGDDERNEYIYKFVSKGAYRPEMDRKEAGKISMRGRCTLPSFQWRTRPMARIDSSSNGIPKKSNPSDPNGFDEADIAIRTREAADLAEPPDGSARVDRDPS